MDGLHIDVETRGGRRIVAVRGDLDLGTVDQFVDAMAHNLRLRPRPRPGSDGWMVLDLSMVGFIGSTGLWALMKAVEDAAAAGAQIRIVSSPVLARAVELVNIFHTLDLYPDLAAALQ